MLCGSLRFGTGDAQWDAQLALEMQLGQHSAMGRCCSDSGAAALSLELHTGAWGWLGVQELLSPSFGKPWKRGGCFGKIEVWSSAQLAVAALPSLQAQHSLGWRRRAPG